MLRQIGPSHRMRRDVHHHFIGLIFRQRTGINAAPFQEDQCRLHASSLVSIKEGLALRKMEAISGGDFENVATAVMINILRRCNG